jgi:pyruvate/2-oxoglutarate dehydrogenase complex dihydrolipoamide dehydrogenase (E3) component
LVGYTSEVTKSVDVVVLGLGVGGEEVAGQLAAAGLQVVGIEDRLVGGECPYWGCIPSKMMIRSANLLAEARRIEGMAGHVDLRPSWAPVAERIRKEATDDWNDKVAVDRLTGKGATFVRGRGRLVGPGAVEVDGRRYAASRAVVLATGSEPVIPPIEGLAESSYWTNREALEATELPRTLTVMGGGAIGLELAQMFARFGVKVTVIEAFDRLLAIEEPESSALLHDVLSREGIALHTSRRVIRVEPGAVWLDNGVRVAGEKLLVATGRRANLADLGLDTVGLDPAARSLRVDDRLRVADGIWAVGDATGHGAFTHIAMYQAGIAYRDILGRPGPAADYKALPRVTFTDPEVGAVGLTQAQALERGLRLRVAVSPLPASSRGFVHKAGNDGFIKLIADADRDVLVGATSAGPSGGEVLGLLALAVHAEVPIDTLSSMIYAYPTFHRAVSDAVARL